MVKQKTPERATGWPKARSRGVVLLTTLLAVAGLTVAATGGAVALQSDSGSINFGDNVDSADRGNVVNVISTAPSEGVPLDSDSTFYSGQDVYVVDLDAGSTYQLRATNDDSEPGTLVRALTATGGSIEFELDGRLADGEFVVVDPNGDVVPVDNGAAGTAEAPTTSNTADASFEVVSQDLRAEFDDASVGNDSGSTTVDYEISSDVRNDYNVNITAESLDDGGLVDIFGGSNVVQNYSEDDETIAVAGDTTYTLEFPDINADTYTFEASVTDVDASDTDDIEVTDTGGAEASFGSNVYTADRGTTAEVLVEFGNTDTATVQFGDPDNNGYYATAQIEDQDGDGEALVYFNSETAGSDGYAVLTTSRPDTVSNLTHGGPFDGMNEPAGSDMLDAADYHLYVTAGEKSSDQITEDADARATLRLQESADAEASLDYDGDTLNVEHASGQTISGTTNLDPGTELEITIDSDESGDPFVFQPEATVQDDGSFTVTQDFSSAEPGTEFDVTVLDGDTELTTADGEVVSGTTLDSESLTVSNAPEQTISGTTSVEPGTELEVKLDSPTSSDPFVKRPEATVQDDGSFTVTADFSDNEPGTEFEVTVLDGDTELTTADGQVTGDETFLLLKSLTVQNEPDQTISGTTELDAGTDLVVKIDSEERADPFFFQPETTVQDDGSFNVTQDFSGADNGTLFDVTVVSGGTELTTVHGQVAGEETETGNETDDETDNETDDETDSETSESSALSMTATSNPTLDGTVRVQFTVENTGGEAAAVTVNASDVVAPDALSLSNHSSDGGVWRAAAQTWLFQNVEPGQSVTAAVDVAVDANAGEQTVTGTAIGNGQEVSAITTVDRDGLAAVQAVDSNDDNELDNSEVVEAINSWRNDDPVGDSNQAITNEEIREIISLWEQGGD